MDNGKNTGKEKSAKPRAARRKYRNDVGNGWLFGTAIRCFRNFIRNWNAEIQDNDVFDIVCFGRQASTERFLRLLLRHFSVELLEQVGVVGRDTTQEDETPEIPGRWRGRRLKMPSLGAVKMPAVPRGASGGCRVELRDDPKEALQTLWNRKALRKACRALLGDLCDEALACAARANRGCSDPMAARAAELVSFLGFDPTETDVFEYAVVRALTAFRDYPFRTSSATARADFYAMAADRPLADVLRALAPDAPLRRYDVLDNDFDFQSGTFRDYLEGGGDGLLEGNFYRSISTADALPLSYHGSLAERHAPLLKDLLAAGAAPAAPAGSGGAAPAVRAPSVLFYGPPGTGKTSFAKTLARELGLDLVEIRQSDDRAKVSPADRLTGLRLCNEQLPAGRALVLVDEADTILGGGGDFMAAFFGGGGGASKQKGALVAALDEARLPAIWITNVSAAALDPAVRRRFDYSIRFEPLDAEKRNAVWLNCIERNGLADLLPPDAVRRLSARYPANAGGIAAALENVRRMAATPERAESLVASLLAPHCELLGLSAGDDETAPSSADYDTAGLNIAGAIPPERILAAVRRHRAATAGGGAAGPAAPDRPRLNILLYGPPGTGKTEFVRHLARESGARLEILTGSSLLDPYVGGTEAKIRDAFRRAGNDGSILFLDDLDGLLMERASARQRWEFTQVNELLHAMENFGGVLAGATNHMDKLDPAVLRRFTFKLRFDYLTPEGKRTFFDRMFGLPLDEAEAARLAAIPDLAPGDYRTVRQALWCLDCAPAAADVLDELEKEASLKRAAAGGGPIGFAAC